MKDQTNTSSEKKETDTPSSDIALEKNESAKESEAGLELSSSILKILLVFVLIGILISLLQGEMRSDNQVQTYLNNVEMEDGEMVLGVALSMNGRTVEGNYTISTVVSSEGAGEFSGIVKGRQSGDEIVFTQGPFAYGEIESDSIKLLVKGFGEEEIFLPGNALSEIEVREGDLAHYSAKVDQAIKNAPAPAYEEE